MGEVRTSYPRFKRSGHAPALAVTDDDVAILRHVYRHRFLRAEDVFRLFPQRSQDRLSRRLLTLFRAGYLDRPPSQIDRFHHGGSQSMVYGLGDAGARHLKEVVGISIAGADWRARNRSYTRDNLDHTLAVARYLVAVEVGCRRRDDVHYIPCEQITGDIRLGRWPVQVEWQGAGAEVHVVPDAIFGLRHAPAAQVPKASYFFLEMDRGTMTIAPARRVQESAAFLYRATILRKLIAYAESWERQLHRAALGIHTPRVLFLTTSFMRAQSIRVAAEHLVLTPRGLPPGIFLFGHVQENADPLNSVLSDTRGQSVTMLPA